MDVQNPTLADWHQLLDEYQHSDGFALRGRLRAFSLSLYAFDKNFESLKSAIEAMKPDEQPNDDTVFEFGDRTEPSLFEVCRCLQNFVSAAMTLVDQSRVLYEKMYEPSGKVPQYAAEIESRFKENPLHQFIQGLRNMTVHYRLPGVSYTVNRQIRIGGSSVSYEVCLEKSDLAQYDGWKKSARQFMDNSPPKINLGKVTSDYHHHVVDFHRWFADRQREAHRQELEQVERLESRLRQMAIEMRNRHRDMIAASLNKHSKEPMSAD